MPLGKLTINGDNIYTQKVKRIQKLTQDTEAKIDGIPGVVNDATSTSTTDALSANMWKVLQDQINELKSMGRFLSTWDCVTGLPTTDPVDDPYDYRIWDYYIVSTISSWTNYRPYGDTYVAGVASTTVETDTVKINDWYLYDGQTWILQKQNQITINIDSQLSTTSTNAVENRVITNALNGKQAIINDLATIRSNAALWASALQPGDNISELTNDSGFQTAWDVANAIAGKANASDLNALAWRVTTAEGTITSQWQAITALQQSQGWSAADISDLKDDVAAIESTIGDINTALAWKADASSLSTVATSWNASDLNNDAGFITASYVGNGQINVNQGWVNKWSFTLNQAWATSIALERTLIISQAEYNQLATKDPNTTYLITDGTPASQAGFINYPTQAEMETAISTAVNGLVDDTAFWSSWNWDTTHAPSKNAIYDVLGGVEALLANL